jgi:hypothetical protein
MRRLTQLPGEEWPHGVIGQMTLITLLNHVGVASPPS